MHRSHQKALYYTVAHDSLLRRMPEIKRDIDRDADFMCELGEELAKLPNPRACVERMGLGAHQSCLLAKETWDPIYGKIVYRADHFTQQSRAVATLDMDPHLDPNAAMPPPPVPVRPPFRR